jgi:hypothetical protein
MPSAAFSRIEALKARRLQFAGQALQHAPVALLVQLGLHLGLEDLRVERFEQVVHRATGIALEHGRGLLVGGEENDRGQPRALAAAHQPGDLEAVHLGHLHVEQDQVDFVFEQRSGLPSRAGGQHLPILPGQQRPHADEVLRIVVYDQ